MKLREKIWNHLTKPPEGERLYWYLILIRWVLYPLDTFYWTMGESRGYQWHNDTWVIEGVVFRRSEINSFKRIKKIK